MARFTIKRGMRSDQWETILVLVNLLNRNLPTFHRVTLFAICSELTFVNISVAIGALLADISKYRFDVALRTSDTLMQSTKRKAGLIVVELRPIANRFPAAECVTVLAGDIERAMRTARDCISV